ncbi:MAG: hypothetical protein V7756_04515, partial [Halopseudomonas sp.]|uniref:hypothetical protein n=1 Tax=Halopseudomonas sp. TaxID=2901191 RepID=UPI00300275E1
QTMPVLLFNRLKTRTPSSGVAGNAAAFTIFTRADTAITYYVDWTAAGFGEVVPEVVNAGAMRMERIVRLTLPSQVNTFNLADLGFPSPAAATFLVSLLQSNFDMKGCRVTTNTTSFTVTLADGSLWGSSARAYFEIIGA